MMIIIYEQSDLEPSKVSLNTLRQILREPGTQRLREPGRKKELVTRQGEEQMKVFRKQQYDQVG